MVMETPPAKSPFLDPRRLPDVLRLIDELARDKDLSQRGEGGLTSTLGPPASADRWTKVVEEHPHFFENVGGDYPLVLRERYHQPGQPPLSDDRISRLRDQATGYADAVIRTAEEIADQGHAKAPEKVAELLTLKPTLWGMGVDLKELGRRCWLWLRRPFGK
jgi:hypothetical protein